ncbi:MAG: single-stranded-DNA-specific exonuclease RecJ, partial [Eubacterium sp.]|nr:single-stranded-DNA-specific exonuclease RecJ [Eubacterium sp.]
MKEKWVIAAKKADFYKIGETFGIDPVIARLIRNRDIIGEEAIRKYLYGTVRDLYDPGLLKGMKEAGAILSEKLKEGRKIRVIGDYDIDGVMSSYILITGLTKLGADADVRIPDRIRDGYGLNENLVREAAADGVDTILTCDNGIAASAQIALARELGMTAVVTDHHEIPFKEAEDGTREYILPPADAVIDAKQPGETYPFRELCGAGVAFKLISYLYDLCKLPDAETEKEELLQYAGFATVGDVVPLRDENRILVREGLARLRKTKNPGLQELISQNNLDPDGLDTFHIGFVLGPCINASGRLDTANRALSLLRAKTRMEAAPIAAELVSLNASRKDMTAKGEEDAVRQVEETEIGKDNVLVVYLPECHESICGIIAGHLKERYYKPTFVLTGTADGLKGSGRSIEAYSMYEELCKCRELLSKFGGHPMAAGISLPEENLEAFRRLLNENSTLTEEDLVPKKLIDIKMPIGYISKELIHQLDILQPYGEGNKAPVFAESGLVVSGARLLGRKGNAAKMRLTGADGRSVEG